MLLWWDWDLDYQWNSEAHLLMKTRMLSRSISPLKVHKVQSYPNLFLSYINITTSYWYIVYLNWFSLIYLFYLFTAPLFYGLVFCKFRQRQVGNTPKLVDWKGSEGNSCFIRRVIEMLMKLKHEHQFSLNVSLNTHEDFDSLKAFWFSLSFHLVPKKKKMKHEWKIDKWSEEKGYW